MRAVREAFQDHLPVMGNEYDNVVALDADLGKATKIASFKESFPERFFQIGIAEANMIGIASGMSEYGYKVFLASFGSFLTGRYDIIRCSLAYPNRPVVLVGTHVGMAIGKDGVTQMGLEDVSLMRALPNMNVLNPATYSEAVRMIDYLAQNELDSPYYLRLGRQPVEDILTESSFEFGKANIVKDMIVKCASETDYLFSVEDHSIVGGLGSAISEVLTETNPKKLVRLGLNDVFPESAAPNDLYEKYGLSSNQIFKRVLDELDK